MLYTIYLNNDEITTLKSILKDRKETLEQIATNKNLSLNQKNRLNEIKNILNKLT